MTFELSSLLTTMAWNKIAVSFVNLGDLLSLLETELALCSEQV